MMRWKRRLSNRKVERLKRDAIITATPYMEHVRDSVAAWRDTYLRTKATLMLDAFDERLVTLPTPADMPFAECLAIELTAFASTFVDALNDDLGKLRAMFGTDTLEILALLEIENEMTEYAVGEFTSVAQDMLRQAGEAANAEAERRGQPGLMLDDEAG